MKLLLSAVAGAMHHSKIRGPGADGLCAVSTQLSAKAVPTLRKKREEWGTPGLTTKPRSFAGFPALEKTRGSPPSLRMTAFLGGLVVRDWGAGIGIRDQGSGIRDQGLGSGTSGHQVIELLSHCVICSSHRFGRS